MSGHVVMDETNNREPNFMIRVFDKNMKMIQVAEAAMYKADGKVSKSIYGIKNSLRWISIIKFHQTVSLLVPEKVLVESRGGVLPKDVPDCGFYGENCIVVPPSSLSIIFSNKNTYMHVQSHTFINYGCFSNTLHCHWSPVWHFVYCHVYHRHGILYKVTW